MSRYVITYKGEWSVAKGQHSWNISVTKEARVDPKVVLESLMECPYFARTIFFKPKQTYFKLMLQALLLVTNQAEPVKL